jgi:hypothetical protein
VTGGGRFGSEIQELLQVGVVGKMHGCRPETYPPSRLASSIAGS